MSFVNGKQVQKTVRSENGVETVEIRENGQLVSKTVNGQQQAIDSQSSGQQQPQAIRHSSSHRSSRSNNSSRGNLFSFW